MTERCNGCGRPIANCPPSLAEPPDHTRLEFESGTDVFAVWRDDESSAFAGYATGDGGVTWCLYGRTVPVTWLQLQADFGACSLALGVRLIPDPTDVPNLDRWPTKVYATTGRWPDYDADQPTPAVVPAGQHETEEL